MLRIATLFSGIGAIEQALKRLGIEYEIVFACDNGNIMLDNIDFEKEKKIVDSLSSAKEKKEYVENLYKNNSRKTNYVKKSYEANYEIKDDMFFYDIKLLDGRDFKGKVDLLVGGSPCQSFSTVGKCGGLKDTRGTLFYEFARLVDEIQPRMFLYENVRGLYTHDSGNTWKVIQSTFSELDYQFKFEILNAADYGIPQNRRRLYVVGYKEKYLKQNFIYPPSPEKKLYFKMKDILLENCKEGNFKSIDGKLTIKKDGQDVDKRYYLSPLVKKYVLSPGTKNFYQKPEVDLDIARTLLSTMGNRHRAGIDNYHYINGELRMLTEREALRLMGFPDDFKIVVSRAQMYKQAGNSIVVDVLMHILQLVLPNLKY